MDIALGWFGELGTWILSWIPRLLMIKITEAGVLYTFGKPRPIGPGRMVLYVPAFQDVDLVPIAPDALHLPVQSVTSHDGKQFIVRFVVNYEVMDAFGFLTTRWDAMNQFHGYAMSAVLEAFSEADSSDIDSTIANDVRDRLQSDLADMVRIHDVRAVDIGVDIFPICIVGGIEGKEVGE